MNNKPIISVVICTYNNAESLAVTLNQLLNQTAQTVDDFELLIIDNNSQDNTQQVCEQFVSKSKIRAKYIFESKQGLSHARNTGVQSAVSEYLLFTDDDAELPKNWLHEYNDKIQTDKRVTNILFAVRDGLMIARKEKN